MTIDELEYRESKIKDCKKKSDSLYEIIDLLEKNWITKLIYKDEIMQLKAITTGLLSEALSYGGLK